MRAPRWQLLLIVLWTVVFVAAVEVLWIILLIPGAILFPALYRWAPRHMMTSRVWPAQQIEAFAWRWLDWWLGNFEDGLLPDWWREQGGSAWSWFTRNPVTNLRFAPLISTCPDPARVRWVGDDHMQEDRVPCCFFAWQGRFGGFRWQSTRWGLWLGFKVKPDDRNGVSDYRKDGVGIAMQLMRW